MSTTSLPIRSTHTDAILKVAIVAAVAVAAVAHVPVIGPHLEEAPYMGVLFIAFTAVCLGLGAAMAATGQTWAYRSAVVVCGSAVAVYVATRLVAFPQLSDVRFSHRWAGAIDTCTRFTAFYGLARRGRIAYAAGFTGLGVGATRFAADVLLDLLSGESTPRTELQLVRQRPLPFPPEPVASIGINLTRWSLDRADHRQGRRNLLLRALDAAGLGFDS